MRFRHIKVKNFRAIKEVDIRVSNRSGVLTFGGLNGSGKTSLLEALMWVLGNSLRDQIRGPLPHQKYYIELEIADDALIPTACRMISTKAGDSFEIREDEFDVWRRITPQEGKRFLGQLSTFYFSSWREPKRVGSLGMTIGKKGKRPAETASNAVRNIKQFLINRQGFSGYASGRGTTGQTEEIFSRLNRVWARFFPDDQGRFFADIASDFSRNDADDEDLSFDLFLERKSVEDRVSVDDLSSGEMEVLSFIGTILMERFRRKKPFDIVFLDEPELHLSQAWHRLLIPTLKELAPETQYVVATHSPDIWDSLYNDERFLLRGGTL